MQPEPVRNLHDAGDPPADVVPIASRAREPHAGNAFLPSTEKTKEGMHATRGDFDALIAPLEFHAAARLTGPNREVCFEEFLAEPAGVRRCVEKARQRGEASRNPIGLFVRMLKDKDHVPPAASSAETEAERLQRRIAEREGR